MSAVKTGYDKRAIKAARVSPDSDAWAQLLVQLAYARLLHARGWKCQSATTHRVFKNSRVTRRSCASSRVRAMCLCML